MRRPVKSNPRPTKSEPECKPTSSSAAESVPLPTLPAASPFVANTSVDELAQLAILHANVQEQLGQKQTAMEAQEAMLQAVLEMQADMEAKLSAMHAAQQEADKNHERRVRELEEAYRAELRRVGTVEKVPDAKRNVPNWWDNFLGQLAQIECGAREDRAKQMADDNHLDTSTDVPTHDEDHLDKPSDIPTHDSWANLMNVEMPPEEGPPVEVSLSS